MALIHGGDMEGYILEYGSEPLDFSANCNPLGIPDGVPPAIAAAAAGADRYPDPLCRRLRAALSERLALPDSCILCGNGAADLIFRLALAAKPKTALVTAPTFAEYELALETAGCRVLRHALAPEAGFALTEALLARITPGLDMLFICNPNNPTGLTVAPPLLRRILAACEDSGTLLVVDECFNGFLDEPEKHTLRGCLKDADKLLILDAFTKLYGMAGVRLGYCMTKNLPLLEAMKNAGQPWAVSSLAQAAGLAALREDGYVARARALVKTEREYLLRELRRLGLAALSGEANYIFFRADVPRLAENLRARGILIRDCGNYAGLASGCWRIAVRPHGENIKLIEALSGLLGQTTTK
ncbi:L-threonine O-3-phosphate decarboxylase [Sporobacter termitidis DSM 10068]|uniref:L-threonine O-3-phosphate decarboxylase n=1 Tax=Sporobacter termitidis DSM 10068 TaxID=1123282 RepID=A0A1M5ZBL1_9FIRM|nr:aminotransferase class I/II-fold pyridoxal phosphate-dependent enzyme [Sporobacter termitidis]SHI21611.1 L-threonine O-3-phosphate decarboxylase [Sporobacter termitidis DSM 10068]